MNLRYIFFIGLMLLAQQLPLANADYIIPTEATFQSPATSSAPLQKGDECEIKKSAKEEKFLQRDGIQQSKTLYSTGSCVDRCHVDYMTYQTIYQEEFFRHRVHSPKEKMECDLCHEKYVDDIKPHGGLTIKRQDCVTCHHKKVNNDGCSQCHAEVKEYMDGWIQDMITKIPDWMSKDVSCTDCHKLELDGASFKDVRNACMECHSSGYGAIYDFWKKILESEVKQRFKNENNTLTEENQNQTSIPNTVLSVKKINILAEYLGNAIPVPSHSQGMDRGGIKTFRKKGYLQLDASNRQNLLSFVQSYGMHNILLSQILLKNIKTE